MNSRLSLDRPMEQKSIVYVFASLMNGPVISRAIMRHRTTPPG